MSVMLLAGALLLSDTPASAEPLTSDQIVRIQRMIGLTQQRDAELKEQLQRRQNELIAVYGDFELDDELVHRLQNDVVSVQRELLSNYHRMQVELRTVVGQQRFAMLKQRIDRVLQSKGRQKSRTGQVDVQSVDGSAARRAGGDRP